MNRRRFLELASFGTAVISGCTETTSTSSPTAPQTDASTRSPGQLSTFADTPTLTETESPTQTESPRQNSNMIFVDIDKGTPDARGSKEEPLESIQAAIDQARPGDTIHVNPGEYRELASTVRSGNPGQPITLTGPKDAILRNHPEEWYTLRIKHSHFHLDGLTVTGLSNPNHKDDIEAYSGLPIDCSPIGYFSNDEPEEYEYLLDIKIKPDALGYSRGNLMNAKWVRDVEIGEFEIIGPAGMDILLDEAVHHNSEIVYIGGAGFTNPESPCCDKSRNIHVHHIDNSTGYPHAELVDIKSGTQNVTVEYCTDAGGAGEAINDGGDPGAVHIGGADIIVRWNVIENAATDGISFYSQSISHETPDSYDAPDGTGCSIYGNRIVDTDGLAIGFAQMDHVGPEDQRVICGNEYNGETHGKPDKPCPDSIPGSKTIGHLGGDSPSS